MTKPRTSPHRELFGILGSYPASSEVLRSWNAYFTAQGIDASINRYPATVATLPERLSEMFHFDRRLYIVAPSLQREVCRLLDALDPQAAKSGRANVVVNRGGVFTGFLCDSTDPHVLLGHWATSA